MWKLPPLTRNGAGEIRRCGFELEYIGLGLAETAHIVQQLYGGNIRWPQAYHCVVENTLLGNFKIELDVQWMHKLAEIARDERDNASSLAAAADKLLYPVVATFAPNEIITPPIPFSELETLDALVDGLRHAGAKGTGESIFYAFGVHVNPEVPGFDAATLLRYLRAFLLLYEWMKHDMPLDGTRMLTGFAKSFPQDYIRLIMSDHYNPDINRLLEDYLTFNPTRNRALDMLPLFATLAPEKVARHCPDSLIHPRPTFHFRLPNCHVNRADWGLHEAWKYWYFVELLASDAPRIAAMQKAYRQHHYSTRFLFAEPWREQAPAWLKNVH